MDKAEQNTPGWKKFYDEGRGYHKTARGSLKRPEIFTPEIVQNIAAMGIEKYFMSIFTHRGVLPRNHTMEDFITEVKAFFPLPADLEESLRYFDSLQQICSIDDYKITKPEAADLPRFVEAINRVALLAERELAGDLEPDRGSGGR
ncbi:MAG: hypothetical protein LBU19_00705 [Treponema sp.]|jgi:hypothetical protein|nr:hypothetical protein [Treponema sp.]